MELLTVFLSALAGAWVIGLGIGAKFGGYGKTASKHPAASIADFLVAGQSGLQTMVFIAAGLGLILTGTALSGTPAVICFGLALLIFAPLPVFVCARIRQVRSAGADKEIVFFNEFRPLGTPRPEKNRNVAFYIEDDEWAEIAGVKSADLKFWQQFYVTDGLYICPCNQEVLQSVDSLDLYRFIISSEHTKMLHAFSAALHSADPTRTARTPHAKRTFIQLQTHGHSTLTLKNRERTMRPPDPPKKDNDEDDDDFDWESLFNWDDDKKSKPGKKKSPLDLLKEKRKAEEDS